MGEAAAKQDMITVRVDRTIFRKILAMKHRIEAEEGQIVSISRAFEELLAIAVDGENDGKVVKRLAPRESEVSRATGSKSSKKVEVAKGEDLEDEDDDELEELDDVEEL